MSLIKYRFLFTKRRELDNLSKKVNQSRSRGAK